MPNQLIIFDLDGTLLNTIDDLGEACNYALPIVACSWGFVPKEQLAAAEPDYLVDKPDQILSLYEIVMMGEK